MFWLQLIAIVSTIVCVYLSGKEKVASWPVGIVSVISLIAVYVITKDYSQVGLQIVFLITTIIGWYNWGKIDPVHIRSIRANELVRGMVLAIVLGIVFGTINLQFNPTLNHNIVYVDGISAAIGLVANWYLTKKVIQAWPLFMVYNLTTGFLTYYQHIYLLVGLNIVLFIISFNGFLSWRKNLRTV